MSLLVVGMMILSLFRSDRMNGFSRHAHHSTLGRTDCDRYFPDKIQKMKISSFTANRATMPENGGGEIHTITMIRVVAPAKLEEGFTFDVLVDDSPFTVVVPKGGVKEGQEFDVPYESGDDDENHRNEECSSLGQEDATLPIQSSSEEDEKFDENGAPFGRWRTKLCGCCDVVTQATFWMGLCCTPVLIAQLLTRFRLTWKGQQGSQEETSLSFNRIVISMIIVLSISKLPLLGSLLFPTFFIVVVVYVGSNLRNYVRKKYRIPSTLPTRWGESIDDCCCMCCCSCCSAIQMARHTHDDKEYPGYGCTTTGLEMSAPNILYQC